MVAPEAVLPPQGAGQQRAGQEPVGDLGGPEPGRGAVVAGEACVERRHKPDSGLVKAAANRAR